MAAQQNSGVDRSEHLAHIKHGAQVRSHSSMMDEIAGGGSVVLKKSEIARDTSGPLLDASASYDFVADGGAPVLMVKNLIPHFPAAKGFLNKVQTVDKSQPVIEEGIKITKSDPKDTRAPHLKAIQAAAEKRSYRLMMQLKNELRGVFKVKGVSLERAFRDFDENRDGAIDYGEFERGLTSLGATLSATQVTDLITMLDKDGDGSIDYVEFARWFGAGPPPAPMLPEMRARLDAREAHDRSPVRVVARNVHLDEIQAAAARRGADELEPATAETMLEPAIPTRPALPTRCLEPVRRPRPSLAPAAGVAKISGASRPPALPGKQRHGPPVARPALPSRQQAAMVPMRPQRMGVPLPALRQQSPLANTLEALASNSGADVHEVGTYALWRLAYQSPEVCRELVALGGLPAIAGALRAHPANAAVQRFGFSVLASVAADKQNGGELRSHRLIPLATAALERCADAPEALEAAIVFIGNMSLL